MLNALGLGIVLTMRDYASMPAGKVQRALLGLDQTAERFSMRYVESMYKVREGMNILAAGTISLLAPLEILKSSFATQEEMFKTLSLGVEDHNALLEKSLEISNKFADITRENYMKATYWIKTGIFGLSDKDVAKYAANAAIVAKATRSTAEEMSKLFASSYGVFKQTLYRDIKDADFIDMLSGALTQTVRIFKTSGHELSLAFNSLTADASAVLYNMEEQFAILGMLQQSMPGRRAGTRLRAFVQGAAEAAQEFNYPIVDAEGHLLSIADLFDRLKKDFKDISQVENIYAIRKAFGSREAFSVFQMLWNRTDEIRKATEQVRQGMLEGMSLAERMAYVMDKAVGQRFKLLTQRISNFFEIVAEAITNEAKIIIDFFSNFVLLLQKIAKQHPVIVKLAFGLQSLVGALLSLAGTLLILRGLKSLVFDTLLLFTWRVAELSKGLGVLLTTFGPIIVAVIALYYAIKNNFLGMGKFVDDIIQKFKTFARNTVLVFRGLSELVTSLEDLRYGRISNSSKTLLESLGLWNLTKALFMAYVRFKLFWEGIKEGFKNAMESIKAFIMPIVQMVTLWMSPIITLVKSIGNMFGSFGQAFSNSNVNAIHNLGIAIGALLGPLITLKTIIAFFTAGGKIRKFFKDLEAARQGRITQALSTVKKVGMTKDQRHAWRLIKEKAKTMKEVSTHYGKDSTEVKMLKSFILREMRKNDLLKAIGRQEAVKLFGEGMVQQIELGSKTAEKTLKRKKFHKRLIDNLVLAPKKLNEGIGKLTGKINDLNNKIKTKKINSLGTSFKNLTGRVKIASVAMLTFAKTIIISVINNIRTLTISIWGLVVSSGSLLVTLLPYLIVIGILVGLGYALYKNWENVKLTFAYMKQQLKEFVDWFLQTKFVKKVKEWGIAIKENIISKFEKLVELIEKFLSIIGKPIKSDPSWHGNYGDLNLSPAGAGIIPVNKRPNLERRRTTIENIYNNYPELQDMVNRYDPNVDRPYTVLQKQGDIIIQVDGREIARATGDAVDKEERRRGH